MSITIIDDGDEKNTHNRFVNKIKNINIMTKLKTLTEIQQELIIKHLAWAENIAKKYTPIARQRGLSKEDVLSSGRWGLCMGAANYNSAKGKFTTYCYNYVRGAILRDINNMKDYECIEDWSNVPEVTDEQDTDEWKILEVAIEKLSPREKRVVCSMYGLSGEQQDIMTMAKSMHLSKSKVLDIKKQSLKKLKDLCA